MAVRGRAVPAESVETFRTLWLGEGLLPLLQLAERALPERWTHPVVFAEAHQEGGAPAAYGVVFSRLPEPGLLDFEDVGRAGVREGASPAPCELPEGEYSTADPSTGQPQAFRVRQLMWEKAGLVRTGDGLRLALDEITALERELPDGASEARHLVTVARLVTRAALARPESRGGHFRADHPDSRRAWQRRLVLSRSGDREHLAFEPVRRPTAHEKRQEVSA